MIYRRIEKKKRRINCIWFGHSLWSANQLLAQEVETVKFDLATALPCVILLPSCLYSSRLSILFFFDSVLPSFLPLASEYKRTWTTNRGADVCPGSSLGQTVEDQSVVGFFRRRLACLPSLPLSFSLARFSPFTASWKRGRERKGEFRVDSAFVS